MRYGVILISILLLTGCVPPTQEQLRMEKDLAEMKRRLARLEMQEASAETSAVVGGDSLQRQVAELVAGLDTLRVDFQSINGRLDDLGQNNQQLIDDLQLTKDDLGLQLADLAGRVDRLEQQPVAVPPSQPVAPQPGVEAPAVKKETAEELYQRALDLVRKDMEFAEGRKLLKTFTDKYPQHDLYVNALYWTGEALYGEKKYELAILQLQDVISKHASHPKAPAAMLKQGLAFNALGDGQNARTTMQKVIEEYPDSPQADSAKKFLEK
ncbi:tol-pal system protein YbgF [Malonomonas rubra DSM 5091]|uniref:Tol-pal system protein YbgF n=1 Tax=Malonomonas rubra DSM 5091 TaxID=1122189 RepID=A0A1M6JRI0_MALRU|nr:tol-pal system protein YbgF [Malonomonas rubra]SHJ49294.1 tol-pal system protein YbgF [Malonomonas rubra DSM 5091]